MFLCCDNKEQLNLAPSTFTVRVSGFVCACGEHFLHISNISVQHYQWKMFYFQSDMLVFLVI